MKKKTEQEKIALIDEALLNNIAGGDGEEEEGPGDCTNHGGCENEEEEQEMK